MRNPLYRKYPQISGEELSPFYKNAIGINTNRDSWLYGYGKNKVEENVSSMINYYSMNMGKNVDYESIANNSQYIKWSAKLKNLYNNHQDIQFDKSNIIQSFYRPFTKKWIYYDKNLVERPGKYYELWGGENKVIFTSGRGSSTFSVLAMDRIPNVNLMTAGQGFVCNDNSIGGIGIELEYSNINKSFADRIGLSLGDTFNYVYGLLNSIEYQQKYSNDLKKDLARIPIVKNKEKYVEIGKLLMDLHINYENVEPYSGVIIETTGTPDFRVTKMKFAKQRNDEGKPVNDRSKVIYNDTLTISGIPEKAYEYVVNGRSAIEWIVDQYQVKTDKKSGIMDDPNDFSDNLKYIFNLLLRIINLSIQSVDLINSLPKLEVVFYES